MLYIVSIGIMESLWENLPTEIFRKYILPHSSLDIKRGLGISPSKIPVSILSDRQEMLSEVRMVYQMHDMVACILECKWDAHRNCDCGWITWKKDPSSNTWFRGT